MSEVSLMATPPTATPPQDKPSRLGMAERLAVLRDWAGASRWRAGAVGGGLLILVASTVGSWLFIAQLTVARHVPTLEEVLEAYDREDHEGARLMVVQMVEQGNMRAEELAGPLFVLGAIKAGEADVQWSVQHERSAYVIASKYLREAHTIGFPPGREQQGMRLLGRCLVATGNIEQGTKVLEELLFHEPADATRIHLAIAHAYLMSSEPQLLKALEHTDVALGDGSLSAEERSEAMLNRIDMLTGLGRFDDARHTLSQIEPTDENRSQILLTSARLDLAEARQSIDLNYADRDLPVELRNHVLGIAQQLLKLPTDSNTSEQALYLAGLAHVLAGDSLKAHEQFEQIRRRFSGSPVGIAASIAEGDLLRSQGSFEPAFTAYQRSLDALEDTRAYQNRLLPLGELRQRLLAAHADFLARHQYEIARDMIEEFFPLVSRNRQLELRAVTLSEWGNHLLARRDRPADYAVTAREGRLRLREAGMAFEELARRRFATSRYPDEVWQSAEAFFKGQSYTEAIRMFDEYLRNEPIRRNAQALLRLGQARLALRDLEGGMLALEECIELHPEDATVYRARLDAAKAYRDREDPRRAEQMLLANLNDTGQIPTSNEWRDSLFELGHLLYDQGQYLKAIEWLQEGVERYPGAEQSRLATYLIGCSFREVADGPLAELEAAQTIHEREKAAAAAREQLLKAYEYLEVVRKQISAAGDANSLDLAMLRNCYMFEGDVLFDLGRVENSPQRFSDAMSAYSNVSTLYHDHPFVLEPLVQIAACQRRLHQKVEARLRVKNALEFLERMPPGIDFRETTNLTRNEWQMLLNEMLTW
jgi:tetratricopeptide (TPR) repeat protein